MILKHMTMTATQTVDGESAQSAIEAPAKWEFEPDRITITYDEQGDMRGTTTVLTVTDDTVTMTRRGITQTDMIFQTKKRCAFDYDTGTGTLKLSTVTETVDRQFTADGGTLTLRYRLYADGALISKNEIVIDIL